MKRIFTSPLAWSLAVFAAGLAAFAGGHAPAEAMGLGVMLAGFGLTDAMVGQQGVAGSTAQAPRQRIREVLPDFQNVVATGRATVEIPLYALTLYRATLKLGGTSFTKAMITEIRLRIGTKVVWFASSGSHVDKINRYRVKFFDASYLTVDFTQPNLKDKGGEYVGGVDMSKLPQGTKVYLDVSITAATAPTLKAEVTWGPPQANTLIQKLMQFTWGSGSGTGRFSLPLVFGGAIVQRLYMIYTGASWIGITATSSAWAGNTGNGVMGAITVSAGAKVGTYKLIITEIIANAAAFVIEDPDGKVMSKGGAVAAAYSFGGLAFTLADGATDFVPDDGFDIVVPSVTDGNLSRMEVKKNGRVEWDYLCSDARFMEQEYGHTPQDLMYVVDFMADNRSDGALQTADAKSLETYVTLTAADNLTIYAEVLDTPENN